MGVGEDHDFGIFSFLARLYESTKSYCCQSDGGMGMGVGITLKFYNKFVLCDEQDTVRRASHVEKHQYASRMFVLSDI